MKRNLWLRVVAPLVAGMLVLGACSGDGDTDDTGVTVVATTTILADLVSNIAGGNASVIALMPIGVDPHDYQPSAAQVAQINRADLVVANGLGLEEGLEDVLDAAANDGVAVLEVGPFIDPLPFGGSSSGDEDFDPHLWFDPLRMAIAAGIVADRLAAVEPAVDWATAAEAYGRELKATDAAITDLLSGIANRRLVTNHDSLGYFAARYDFTIIGTVIPSGTTLGDPSSQELAALVETMQREGVSVIFAETTQPSALADAVAAELGSDVAVVSLFTGSVGEPGSGAETLTGMLLTNARRIAEALRG